MLKAKLKSEVIDRALSVLGSKVVRLCGGVGTSEHNYLLQRSWRPCAIAPHVINISCSTGSLLVHNQSCGKENFWVSLSIIELEH